MHRSLLLRLSAYTNCRHPDHPAALESELNQPGEVDIHKLYPSRAHHPTTGKGRAPNKLGPPALLQGSAMHYTTKQLCVTYYDRGNPVVEGLGDD